ncbi:hypothetical protein GCM10010439_02950 [Actinocorallia aurantiaca]|uniref:Uncharacterized protein n=1 Tax=Actinocorallia aurantiaca TaxID=46204 RepID=A0ABP6G8G8_9ACTN
MERLDVGHHALVGEGLFAVLFGDLDVAFTFHQIGDIDGGNPEAFDRVGSGHGIRREELPQTVRPLGRSPHLVTQRMTHLLDLTEDPQILGIQLRRGKQHAAMMH